MDGARIHRKQETNTLCSRFGCSVRFLSPYSYMLNPVENIFSKIKANVRNVLGRNDSNTSLQESINNAIMTINENDLINYFAHMSRNIALAIDMLIFDETFL